MEDLLDAIRPLGQSKTVKKGFFLFHAGDETAGFFYVERGEVRVFKMDEQGREMEVVRISPGGFLAEAIIFASDHYPLFAQATDDSEVLFFPRDAILKRLREDPSLGEFFIRLLAKKCVVLNQKIESLGLLTVRQRVARYLLERCSGEMQCAVKLEAKKGEIAQSLGTISETLSRTLKQLQEDGIIAVEGPVIRILDCTRIRAELSPRQP
jgi:CRP-like cAMP-binding protein